MQYPFHPVPVSTVSLAATSTSGYVAFTVGMPTGRCQVRVANPGTKVAFIRPVALSSEAALVSDIPILPGAVEVISVNNNKNTFTGFTGITAGADTTTLYFTLGQGI